MESAKPSLTSQKGENTWTLPNNLPRLPNEPEEPPVTQHEIDAVAAVIWHETANDNDPLDYNAIARADLEAARRAR